jgi:integrase
VAAEQWLSERIDHTHRKAELIRGYVDRAIIPALGSRRVRDIEPSDIAIAFRNYRDQTGKKAAAHKGGRTAARPLLGVFKDLFGYAVANGWIKLSPAAQLTAAVVGPPGAARSRVLSDDEIGFVMTTDIRQGPVLRFLLVTGLRIGEAYNGHRKGQYWVVPTEFSKNKREHRVWLSDLALAQLDRHPWEAPQYDVQHWLADNTGGWCAHDLRRTFSTRNNGMGGPALHRRADAEPHLRWGHGRLQSRHLRRRAAAGPRGVVGLADGLHWQASRGYCPPATGFASGGMI